MSKVIEFPNRSYTAVPPVWTLIPQHMHYSVQDYVERGLLDDEFLEAMVCNDLYRSVIFADKINIKHLEGYVKFFNNYCPAECWGNKERVENWVLRHGLGWGLKS